MVLFGLGFEICVEVTGCFQLFASEDCGSFGHCESSLHLLQNVVVEGPVFNRVIHIAKIINKVWKVKRLARQEALFTFADSGIKFVLMPPTFESDACVVSITHSGVAAQKR